MEAQIEMPKYRCHKEVWALKIKEVKVERRLDGDMTLSFFEERFAPIVVSKEYREKHEPQAGGYYVVYKGGYKSFSPQEAFEEGYSKV